MHTMQTLQEKVALITGAAHRIGAAIARILHNNGMHLVVHYHQSQDAAQELAAELNAARPDTVTLLQADLLDTERFSALINSASLPWGRLDVLVNNASSFYPTQVGEVTLAHRHQSARAFFSGTGRNAHARRTSGLHHQHRGYTR